MKFRVIFDYDPVTQSYSAVCPELTGCASAGETEIEARQNSADAIRLYLAPTDIDLRKCEGGRCGGWVSVGLRTF
jgi:predicted RNase H-like HicB family nuclease